MKNINNSKYIQAVAIETTSGVLGITLTTSDG